MTARRRYLPRMVRSARPPLLRALAVAAATLALGACGSTVSIHGTADEAWSDTVAALRAQGVLTPEVERLAADPTRSADRPRIDREAGEIDIPMARSVYYGDAAAFVQVDVDEPAEILERTVRVWIDYPTGLQVVRYGRALDPDQTAEFHRAFEAALAKVRAGRPAPAPAESETK